MWIVRWDQWVFMVLSGEVGGIDKRGGWVRDKTGGWLEIDGINVVDVARGFSDETFGGWSWWMAFLVGGQNIKKTFTEFLEISIKNHASTKD